MKKLLFMLCLLAAAPVAAEQPAFKSGEPVTISAAKSLEWNRKAKTYTAKQDVIVTQGKTKLTSDTLVAHYRDDNGSPADIKTLEADGHVAIEAAPYTAYGDHAVYDVATGNATLTGKDLKIISGDKTLTAQEKIIYARDQNKMTARGNVVIKTANETATGDEAVYDLLAEKAALTGKVRILQGESWLEGTRADVDMKTGISRLSGTGNAATEGRVTGTFYPKPKAQDVKQ